MMQIKYTLVRQIKKYLRLVAFSRFINHQLRVLLRLTHKLQFLIEWRVDNPEYFEHQMDLNWKWHETRNSYSMERGVFSSFALKNDNPPSGITLDLCCGDGFYSYYFYSKRSAKVVAIDFDTNAIRFAKKNYERAKNIEFIIGDIRIDIPEGPFDNIIWDAAIEHFTESEIDKLIRRIKSVLKSNGTLSGYTIVELEQGGKHLHQHEYEFHNKEDLARFLSPYFKNVHIFSTTFSDRVNLYFYATNEILPFERDNCLVVH